MIGVRPIGRWMGAVCGAVILVGVGAAPASADSVRDRQWHLKALEVAEAHQVSKGGGVTVGLIDSGVAAKHRDLAAAVVPGIDTAPNPIGDGREDLSGHGTNMAGIIAGRGHGGGDGVLGIAPAAKVLPISTAVDTISDGTDVVEGIDFAIRRGAKVINMSFGSVENAIILDAVRRAQDADIVLVAAVGNKDESGDYPGKYPEVLTVGAVDRSGKIADFSVTGPQVDVVAPGVDIATTGINDSGYYLGSGTSEATAVVSGAAALIRAKYPKLSAADVVHRITATATDAGAEGRDDTYGYGRLDLMKALTAKVGPAPVESTAPSAEAAAPSGPDDGESRSLPVRQMMPLVLGIGAGLIVLLAGIVVLVVMMRRRA